MLFLCLKGRENVNEIMVECPYFIGDNQLFVRRFLPTTRRYSYEGYFNTNKILVRVPRENYNEISPDNNIIADYLKAAIGQILRLERFEKTTV